MGEIDFARRRLLEILTVGGLTATVLVPSKWIKPIVESIIVPAHAQASAFRPHNNNNNSTTPSPSTSPVT